MIIIFFASSAILYQQEHLGLFYTEIDGAEDPNEYAVLARSMPPTCMQKYGAPQFCFRNIEVVSTFKQAMKSCNWTSALDTVHIKSVGEILPDGAYMTGANPYDDPKNEFADVIEIHPEMYTVQKCAAAKDGWAALRLGPFNTSGGYRWTTSVFAILLPSSIFSQRMIGGVPSFSFDAYCLGSITPEGSLIGHPPIHQHHYHFFGRGDHPTDVMNMHGEQQCLEDEGGVDCYIKGLPKGYAFVTSQSSMAVSTGFNDVRPLGSRMLQSWVLAAARSSSVGEHVRRVSMMRVELRPLPTETWESRQTYNISVSVDSWTWDSGTLTSFHGYQTLPGETGAYRSRPVRSNLVEGSLHAHADLTWDVMFFQGTPDQVFSNLSVARRGKRITEYGVHTIPTAMENIRLRMLQADRANLACSWKTSRRLENAQVAPHLIQQFARMPRCNIDPDIDAWVLIALHHNSGQYHKPNDFDGPPGKYLSWRTTARMHAYVRIYYAEQLVRHIY